MASPVAAYQQEMHENLGFFANWLPGDRIDVGDVGVLKGGRFRRMASLKELNIKSKLTSGGPSQNVEYASTYGTTISSSAGVEGPLPASAEITIEFSHEGAFVFHALRLREESIEDRLAVGAQVVKAYKDGVWKEEWFLVDGFRTAGRATIIVSQDRSAGLILAATAHAALPGASLADPKIGLRVASTRGKMVQIIGAANLRPLYSCLRVSVPLIGSPGVQPVRGQRTAAADPRLTRPAIEELLAS
jgi:hypothetical protein